MTKSRSRWRGRLPEALPSLNGPWRWPFLAVWSATLLVALVAAAASLPPGWRMIGAAHSPIANTGLMIYDAPGGSGIALVFGRDAIRHGLKRGMRVVSVNGRPLAIMAAERERQFAGPDGGTVTVVAMTPDGVARTATLTRDPARYRAAMADAGLVPLVFKLLAFGLPSLTSLGFLGGAILLMARRRHDRLAPWASLMQLWMVIGVGYPGYWLAVHFADPDAAYSICNGIAFGLLIVVLAAFPGGRFEPRWSLAVAVIGFITNILAAPLPDWKSNVALELAQFAAVATIAARFRHMPPGAGRQQIRWALYGFAMSFVALLFLMAFQFLQGGLDELGPALWVQMAARVSGTIYSLVLIGAITVSLMRYRLYGADATISRSVAYGVLTLGLIAVFAAAEKTIELTGEHYLGAQLGTVASAMGAAIAAMMVVPLHHSVTHWAERRFRSGLAYLRHGLPLVVGDLREIAAPAVLADAVLTRIERGVRARHGVVVIGDAVLESRDVDPAAVTGWLAAKPLPDDAPDGLLTDRADPLFPLRVPLHADGVGFVGWLLLGPRPDGSFYGREERTALREIADPVARGLAVAIARERRENELAARDADRQARQDGVMGAVEAIRRFISSRYGIVLEPARSGTGSD